MGKSNLNNNKMGKVMRLLAYFKKYKWQVTLSLVLALLINSMDIINPIITKIIIDDYLVKQGPQSGMISMCIFFLIIVVLSSIVSYSQAYLVNYIGQNIIHNIRMQLFKHIQKLPIKFYDTNSTGQIMTRATNDIEALSDLYSGVFVDLIKDVTMLIGVTVVMISLNLKLALISFSVVPIIVIVTYLYTFKAQATFKRVKSLTGRLNGFFAENISGMKIVQIFHKQKEKFEQFKEINDEYNRASIVAITINALFKPVAELINSLGIAIIIWFCASQVFNNTLEIGVLSAFLTYIKKFFNPINDLADKFDTIQSGLVSADRVFELLDNNDDIEDLDSGVELNDIKGIIEFRNVWFSYNNRDYVLKDVSFKVDKGDTVAFVGATGSGKTTIINLLGRFYKIQKGEILLDGVNINDIKLSCLRKYIAVVIQDVFLFSGTITSNIKLNSDSITDEEVINSAKYVGADSFIEKLDGGYDEIVRERGCTLSFGQRQLISFARAISHNPSILVLDEATANIDTETEKVIQDSLKAISKNRTTIIIAHRLSTIKEADKIVVIDKGVVKEIGSHEELVKKKGYYFSLYEKQSL